MTVAIEVLLTFECILKGYQILNGLQWDKKKLDRKVELFCSAQAAWALTKLFAGYATTSG